MVLGVIVEREFEIPYKGLKKLQRDLEEIEEKYHGLVLEVDVAPDHARIHLLSGIGDRDVYVSVWDCRATLVVGSKTERDLPLNDEQRKLLEEWKNYVICDENDGAINWSGIYYPSHESLQVLRGILRGNVRKAWLSLNALRKRSIQKI
jgi:hypothetical protein